MLRTEPVYDITVATNDGYELNYLFITHPTPADLLVATRERQDALQGVERESEFARYNALREILPLLHNIPKPELKGSVDTDILIASTKVGTIRVLCHPATVIVSNRGRKRKAPVDITKLTPDQYRELRETNPEAVGQPTA